MPSSLLVIYLSGVAVAASLLFLLLHATGIFTPRPQSCGTCKYSRTDKSTESGQEMTACFFNPPALVAQIKNVDGKDVSVLMGRFPGVSPDFKGCGQYKRSRSKK